MNNKENKNQESQRSQYQKLEDVVGCKWSVSVLLAIMSGTNRPGALQREIEGISVKVLSERLRKLTAYGLISKRSFAEVPPRTMYSITESGRKLISIIEQIRVLDKELGTD